jgi:hypothetical protein
MADSSCASVARRRRVPFIAGSLVKNAPGALLVPALRRLVDRRRA